MELLVPSHLSPDEIFARLLPGEKPACFLSAASTAGWGTFIGFEPCAVFSGDSDNWQTFVAEQHVCNREVIGYISFDAVCQRYGVFSAMPAYADLPAMVWYAFDTYILHDANGYHLCAPDEPGLVRLRQIFERPREVSPAPLPLAFSPLLSKPAYTARYNRVRQYLRDGDIYQVNLTHCLRGSTPAADRAVALRIFAANPVDFFAYIETAAGTIISASPERFVLIDKNIITTMPVKGTRPRGLSAAADEKNKRALIESEKEQAELAMITDLMRNDLGAVCLPGTIRLKAERVIVPLTSVWHAQAEIEGQLAPQWSVLSAVWEMLPGGSISGCPKRRALEIIAELESCRRGVYTGVIGRLRREGRLDMSIVIRTVIKQGEDVFLPVGGGIVWDSDATSEWEETFHKAVSLMQ